LRVEGDDNQQMINTPSLHGLQVLAHLGIISAQGQEAAAFLHGQLTNDFSKLDLHHARLAGYCSPKGRLLASFVGWKQSSEQVVLVCSADLLAATLKRLSMFVMRAQCKLFDESANFQVLGLAGESALRWLGESAPAQVWEKSVHLEATVVRLPAAGAVPRFLWTAAHAVPAPALPSMGKGAWQWGEVHSAVAHVGAATSDLFVPQMLNYELVGGVDFQKGCYPGQEVVARSQYRGTTKRRCMLFACSSTVEVGQEIFHSEEPHQPAGVVVSVALIAGQETHFLAEIKLTALGHGTLQLGQAGGALVCALPMPYEVTANANN
jgi:tRNA-modifying protein YgfZ